MAYYYEELDVATIAKAIDAEEFNVYGKDDFLKAVTKVYSCDVKYGVVFLKKEMILIIAFFKKGKNIILPNHYFYQFVWEKFSGHESWIKVECWDFLLKEMIKRYDTIKLKLPIDVYDIRPFSWNNFFVNIRYTYIKNVSTLNYHPKIKTILKKPLNGYSFKMNCDWDDVWSTHIENLNRFGIKRDQKNIITYMKELNASNYIMSFNAYYDDKYITSILAIVDSKLAYIPFVGKSDGHYNKDLHVFLYNYTFSKLKELNVLYVDLFGANIKSIARFKHKFYPTLHQFLEVSYERKSVILKLSILLKKIRKKLFS